MWLAFANFASMSGHLAFFLSDEDAPAKREILRAALRLFVKRGLCETSIRDIAQAAGYTNPALFKHFASKNALAHYLFEQCYTHFSRELRQAINTQVGIQAQLHALVRRFTELLDEQEDAFLYLNDNLRRFWPQVSPAMRKHSMIAIYRNMLVAAVNNGELPQSASTQISVAGISGLLTQFSRLHYFDEFKGPAQRWADDLEQALRALLRLI